jgi:hypothetical protein
MTTAYIVKHLRTGGWSLQLVRTAQDGATHIVAEVQIDDALGLVTLAEGLLYDVAAVSGLTIEARRGGDATEAEDRATARLVAAAPLMHAALEAEEAAQWYYAASIGGLLDEYGRELCKRADQLRREALAASRPPELSEARRGTEQ